MDKLDKSIPIVPTRRILQPDKDRKSTRLNSSHSQISYAVFCLKKKTTSSITDVSSIPRSMPNHLCALKTDDFARMSVSSDPSCTSLTSHISPSNEPPYYLSCRA